MTKITRTTFPCLSGYGKMFENNGHIQVYSLWGQNFYTKLTSTLCHSGHLLCFPINDYTHFPNIKAYETKFDIAVK